MFVNKATIMYIYRAIFILRIKKSLNGSKISRVAVPPLAIVHRHKVAERWSDYCEKLHRSNGSRDQARLCKDFQVSRRKDFVRMRATFVAGPLKVKYSDRDFSLRIFFIKN